MKTRITKANINRLQPGQSIADDEIEGFQARRLPSGSITYVYRYRLKTGERKIISLGTSAKLTPEQARREAGRHHEAASNNGDPVEDEKRRNGTTVNSVLDEFITRYASKKKSGDEVMRTFERLVRPAIGLKSIYLLKRSEIVGMLDEIEDRNGPAMADHVLAYVRKAFNWQATRDDDFKSPIVKGMARTKPRERARTRVLDDDEIRTLWRALDQWPADHGYPQLMRTMLLTGLRIDAASRGHAKEIKDDTWIVPKDRTKQLGGDFLLPLSAPVEAMVAGKNGYLFSTDGGKTSISGFSKFKRRLDAKIKTLRRGHPMKHWTNHDLRRTARTLLSSLSTPDIAERCLAHVIPGVRGVYDLHDYELEKRDAFAALANRVLGIVDPHSNVVALKLRNQARL